MVETAIQPRPYSSSINLLRPVDLVLKLVQGIIDALVCQLECLVKNLSFVQVSGRTQTTSSSALQTGASEKLSSNLQEEVYNLLDVPRIILNGQLNILHATKLFLIQLVAVPVDLVTKPISLFIGYTAFELNSMSDRVQPYVPVKLPKLVLPFGNEQDWSKVDLPQPLTDFHKLIESIFPFRLFLNPFDFFKNIFPARRQKGKITQLEKYNKDLIELIEKERKKHLDELSKIGALKENDDTAAVLDKTKREYDQLKQELLDKIADEIEQHREELDKLKNQSEKDKVEADDKLIKVTKDLERQKRELQDKIDEITISFKGDKAIYENKIEKLELDHKKQTVDLLDQLDTERIKNEKLAKQLKDDVENQKTNFLDKAEREKEANQKAIDDLLTQKREDKIKYDDRIAQLNKDIAAQKLSFLEQIDSKRQDCEKEKLALQDKIDAVTSSGVGDKALLEAKLQKLELDCKNQIQELTLKFEAECKKTAELTKLKEEVEKEKTACLNDLAQEKKSCQSKLDELLKQKSDQQILSDEKISQLNKDIAAQKQSCLDQIEKERKDCADKIEKLTSENGDSNDPRTLAFLKKLNQSLEEQKQDLTSKLSKEREQYLQELSNSESKCTTEKTTLNAKIAELTSELEKQKQLSGAGTSSQKALDDQKAKFDQERSGLNAQLQTLQTKCDALEKVAKDQGFFGKVNDLLAKPAGIADKVTKPLQETGFGKIFG